MSRPADITAYFGAIMRMMVPGRSRACPRCWYRTPDCSIHGQELASSRPRNRSPSLQPRNLMPRAVFYSPTHASFQLILRCRVLDCILHGSDVYPIPVTSMMPSIGWHFDISLVPWILMFGSTGAYASPFATGKSHAGIGSALRRCTLHGSTSPLVCPARETSRIPSQHQHQQHRISTPASEDWKILQ